MKSILRINSVIALTAAFYLQLVFANASMGFQNSGQPSILPMPVQPSAPNGYFNLRAKTLGGKQYWTDIRHSVGWRIQENAVTGHFRLLDPSNVRQAWGSVAHCEQKLNGLVQSGQAQSHRGKVVIALHGMIRTRDSMNTMARFLTEKGKYQVVNFQYASTKKEVAEHGRALGRVISSLGPDVTEINFVAHSLGNLVIRSYLQQHQTAVLPGAGGGPAVFRQGDPRIGRIVMVGAPNQGSKMARMLKGSLLFQGIAGKTGMQLANGWEQLEPQLATPDVPFGIIAGGKTERGGINNWTLTGPNDFTVSAEETKLPGAADFLLRPLFHSTMMNQPETLNATLRFFQHGYFVSEQDRKPIPLQVPPSSMPNLLPSKTKR